MKESPNEFQKDNCIRNSSNSPRANFGFFSLEEFRSFRMNPLKPGEILEGIQGEALGKIPGESLELFLKNPLGFKVSAPFLP